MSIFKAENIVKDYSNLRALNDVSISVEQGKVFGLLGPNGAGKSTLIRIINQIIGPDSGELYFNEQKLNIKHIDKIGYLPEERGLYRKMKVGEQALYLAQLKGMKKRDAKQKLKMWFEKFEMEEWWNRNVESLSKGMQQKVQFVVTILHEPELLILDEPFSGFDPINAEQIKKEILNLKDNGTTIVLSTHNMSSVEELCDDIALINKSEKILGGNLAEIRQQYGLNRYKVEFAGGYNKIVAAWTTKYKFVEHVEQNDKTSLIVELNEDIKQNDLLKQLMEAGEISSFQGLLPSMNEIFLKAVEDSKAS